MVSFYAQDNPTDITHEPKNNFVLPGFLKWEAKIG